MRQATLQTTAPLDPDPRWPEGYVEVLRQAGAQEKAIPYHVSWVRRFFAGYPNRPRRELGRTEVEAFLSETARRPGVSNWMVQQARNAIETYYERFRGIPLAPRQEAGAPEPPPAVVERTLTDTPSQAPLRTLAGPYQARDISVKRLSNVGNRAGSHAALKLQGSARNSKSQPLINEFMQMALWCVGGVRYQHPFGPQHERRQVRVYLQPLFCRG